MSITVKIKKLHDDAVIPVKAYSSDAGFDLCAAVDVLVAPGETIIVRTGLAFELPDGYEMQVRPRSGISTKTKLRVVLGTIDCQYRGEIGVIVDNISPIGNEDAGVNYIDGSPEFYTSAMYQIRKGDRIAQAVIHRIPDITLSEVEVLSASNRGRNGFGSTGVGVVQ